MGMASDGGATYGEHGEVALLSPGFAAYATLAHVNKNVLTSFLAPLSAPPFIKSLPVGQYCPDYCPD